MKTELNILQILSDGRFHSGQELGDELQLSRSAIWKAITKIENMAIEVHRVKRRGYKLPFPIELLNKSIIESYLIEPVKIDVLATVESTNDYLLNLARRGTKAPYVVMSEHQSAGRGRHNREWDSPFGNNIYLSLLWQFQRDPSELSGLSIVIGVSIVEALKAYGVTELQLKWPNDVLWQQQKLAGVLIDMFAESHHQTQVVIGIGINLAAQHQLHEKRVGLQNITGQQPERNRITGLLIKQLQHNLITFSNDGLQPFLSTWRQVDLLAGKKINVTTNQGNRQGTALGIGDGGELVYECQGERRSILNGTVRII